MKSCLALAMLGITFAVAAPLSQAAAAECLPVLRYPPKNPAMTAPPYPVSYSSFYYSLYEPFCADKPAGKCIWACIKVPTCPTRCAS
jgi:hypothetical protein